MDIDELKEQAKLEAQAKLKAQARELAGIYKLRYLSDIFPIFMCPRAKNRYPQLYDMLYGIFRGKDLVSVVEANVPPVSYIPSCHPNLVRYQYLRYIGRYGKAPPWKLVHQWILKANELRLDNG